MLSHCWTIVLRGSLWGDPTTPPIIIQLWRKLLLKLLLLKLVLLLDDRMELMRLLLIPLLLLLTELVHRRCHCGWSRELLVVNVPGSQWEWLLGRWFDLIVEVFDGSFTLFLLLLAILIHRSIFYFCWRLLHLLIITGFQLCNCDYRLVDRVIWGFSWVVEVFLPEVLCLDHALAFTLLVEAGCGASGKHVRLEP